MASASACLGEECSSRKRKGSRSCRFWSIMCSQPCWVSFASLHWTHRRLYEVIFILCIILGLFTYWPWKHQCHLCWPYFGSIVWEHRRWEKSACIVVVDFKMLQLKLQSAVTSCKKEAKTLLSRYFWMRL